MAAIWAFSLFQLVCEIGEVGSQKPLLWCQVGTNAGRATPLHKCRGRVGCVGEKNQVLQVHKLGGSQQGALVQVPDTDDGKCVGVCPLC